MWFELFLIVVLIAIVWWLLTRNANSTETDQPINSQLDNHMIETDKESVDDLSVIEGIGPKISSILKDAGINTFKKLCEAKPEEIKAILTQAGIHLGDPGSWPEQACLAAEGKFEDLLKLQDALKGGRVVE